MITLVVTFLHNLAFNAGTFYLALYFQVRASLWFLLVWPLIGEQAVNGLSPLEAGMTMLPYSLGSSLASMPSESSSSLQHFTSTLTPASAQLPGSLGTISGATSTPPVKSISSVQASPCPRSDSVRVLHCLHHRSAGANEAQGLMMLMSDASPRSTQVAFPLIAGVGLGMLFHAPYQVFTRALRRQEVAAGTSAFFLVRCTGATVGLVSFLCFSSRNVCRRRSLTPRLRQAVAGAVFRDQLSETLPAGVSASSVLESLDVLQSRDDWPAILRALTLAIKVRVPAFRGIPPD